MSLVSLSTLPVSRPAAEPGTVTGAAVGHPAGSGSGIVGQLPVWSAGGAGVKTASPAEWGPSLARRLDGGEHGRMMRCPTMPSVTTGGPVASRPPNRIYVPPGVCYARDVSTDAKAIIGTIVGTGLVVAGLLSAQIAGLNVRIDDVNGRIDDVNGRLERLETDVRSMDDRLRAVEIAFGKVDQRLLTIERVLLPAATPDR